MVEWLAGNRIIGTNAERTTGAGFNPVSAVAGGWKKLDSRTQVDTSGNDSRITITGLDNKKYYMVLVSAKGSNDVQTALRIGFGGTISTSGYVTRYLRDGTANTVTAQTSSSVVGGQNTTGTNGSNFDWYLIENISGKEKLIMGWNASTDGTSTTNVKRAEIVSKNTGTGVMNSIELFEDSTNGSYDTGTEVVVLGWDPADTHTDNYWQLLATATGSSSSASFDTGTFAAKKYLMVTGYAENTQSFECRFNDSASGTYTRRYSGNFANDIVGTSSYFGLSLGTTKVFYTQMIANPSNSYKLIHQTGSELNADNAAGTRPNSFDAVTQWRNNAQITKMTFSRAGGNFSGDEKIMVWGSD